MKSLHASFQDHHKHKVMMKWLGFANEACVNVNSARRILCAVLGSYVLVPKLQVVNTCGYI